MEDDKNLNDLNLFINRPEIIRQVGEQIKKDFEMSGLTITFSGDPDKAYEELFFQVFPLIEKLLELNSQKFFALLYRIDLNEEQIRKTVQENPSASFPKLVADLILKRELQKVVLRNRFKNQ